MLHTPPTELINLLDSSDMVTVSGGSFPVNIQNGQPKIYYPANGEGEHANTVMTVSEKELSL